MKKIIILGAGIVGSAVAADLCQRYRVSVVDFNEERLRNLKQRCSVDTVLRHVHDPMTVQDVVADCDLVIGALPGFMGFHTLMAVIDAGKDIVDISFFNEDPLQLDEFAKEKGVTAVVDCGVAPGMPNIILGYHSRKMEVEEYECYVGGMPFERKWPFQYKAPFSPSDVIEEYPRPARMMENGKVVVKTALSDPEYIDIDPIGTFEAFNTDGLRTLLKTIPVRTMKEKTLRFPGHRSLMAMLRETGFFGKEKVQIGSQEIVPLELTEHLLFPKWHLKHDEPEFTVMRLRIAGTEDEKRKEYIYKLFDQYDRETQTSSMARTTGYTGSAVAELVLQGAFDRKGVCPPEYLGFEEPLFRRIMDYMQQRKIHYRVEEKTYDSAAENSK